jgi:hypothetical protein
LHNHPEIAEAYTQAAEKNVLAALNPKIFFGYFSVCADGQGHGGNTTFPGLDWGQSAEALLWLGRRNEVLASWEYVKGFQRPDGLMPGGGFYLERPTRLEFDGVNQCYSAHTLALAALLFAAASAPATAARCREGAVRLTAAFRQHFWAGDHCVEYLHPEHGAISHHGLTDVDWAAVATGVASAAQIAVLWPQLKDNEDFIYNGIPTGISTRPETYADWEMQNLDRHDLAAMGRVWYLECWARAQMSDQDGLLRSLRRVAEIGAANGWSWRERYYSTRTGDLASYAINHYCEYPANFIRITNRFLAH